MNKLQSLSNSVANNARKGRSIAVMGTLLCLSAPAISQDIEIYSATLGTGDAGTINPNLLFIADTSGSMAEYVATEVTRDTGNYDPDFDYGDDGDAADDDYIYVYDSVESYSGVYITPAQNACQTIDTTWANNPEYPVYFGQAMQWIPQLVEVEVEEAVVCVEDNAEATVEYSGLLGTENDGWQTIATFDHTQITGGSMELDVTPVDGYRPSFFVAYGVDGRLQVRETDSGGNPTGFWSTTSCILDTNHNSSDNCTLDYSSIPYTYFELRISLRSESETYSSWFFGTTPAQDISHETVFSYNIGGVTYSDGEGGACTPSDPVYDTVEDGDWTGNLQIGETDEFILECEADAGEHGRTDASPLTYAALCGTANCADPYYVSSNGIDWTTTGVEHKYFMDGNYHDYLNRPLTVEGERVWEVAQTYYDCNYDGTDCSVEYSSPYSLETWCDENENDIFYREDDDTYTPVGNYQDAYFTDSVNDPGTVYTCQTKQEIMIDALSDMASSMTGVNLGLMQFNTSQSSSSDGGTVTFSVRDIDAYMGGGMSSTSSDDSSHPSVRSSILSEIQSLPASGGTPLSETMYEAYRYFAGLGEVNNRSDLDDDYQENIDESPNVDWSGNYNFMDRDFSSNGESYDSPIDHSCQLNNIVYLTDGEPSGDTSMDGTIESLVGNCDGNCLDELAGYMYNNDMMANNIIDGVNNVTTYTIGFDIDFDLLEQTAQAGGGSYYIASNYSDLMAAFQEILVNIALSEPSVLVAPAVSVNAFNELQHRDQIYYATFKPRSTPKWEGNVKKYTITGDGIVMDNSDPPTNAIDAETGFFSTYAQSYWSDTPDGAYVEVGGYREQLTNTRNVYVDGESLVLGVPGTINQLQPYSSILSPGSQLKLSSTGAADSAEAADLRDWILGIDIDDEDDDGDTTDAHQYAGESLHSKPFVITYSGTSEADAHDVLIVTTNQGVLHAIDARNNMGTEMWAYIPDETIDNIKKYRDDPTNTEHVYGLDGEATVWTTEAADSSPTNFNVETAYMYQGMRRGGDKYFGWDISNGDLENAGAAPISEMWTIDGGTTGFADLGQTWSKMIRTKIRYGCDSADGIAGCTQKDVLVFSGGYDTYYDDSAQSYNEGAETTDIKGNAVYVVDALTGDLLWSTGKAGSADSHLLTLPMYNSVPADPSPVDIDGDGDMDILYFVDISGMVYRVDFNQTNGLDNTYATGGVIANLRENSVFRRFYNGLDVSLITPTSSDSYMAISVGSGYRAHPKEEEAWANHFYVLVDENLYGPEEWGENNEGADEDAITYSYVKTYVEDGDGNPTSVVDSRDIIRIEDLHVYSGADPYDKGEDGDYGFYKALDSSIFEKILQSSVTFNGEVLVSSYTPISDTTEATCGSGQIGAGRVYKFNVRTGESTFDIDGDGVVDENDGEYINLAHEGIPPDPTILLVPELVTCIGTECSDDWLTLETGKAERTYWREE
jgi:type IV pilus assembly protein PilY1